MQSFNDFKIQLEEKNIILRGSVDESAGVMLRGSIILNCHEQTKVKTIVLKFTGKTNVHWTEGGLLILLRKRQKKTHPE
jgi:hypothetical protein